MASVNNATGVYATLGYNFSDPNGDILNLSANTVAHLNSVPAFIESWQAQDIANASVNGYYQNPVSTDVSSIITISQNLMIQANTANTNGYTNAFVIFTSANSLLSTAQSFLAHTNRISGITAFTGQDVVNPYYNIAMGLGKTAMYITNQTDNITNTSPILGSFTSILIGPQIKTANTTLASDLITLTSAVTGNTISNTLISTIVTDIVNTNTLLSARQSADVTYFGNLRTFVNNYNTTKKFTNMGETETFLINNFVGTDKIKSRING
jgi:hypothetical protein